MTITPLAAAAVPAGIAAVKLARHLRENEPFRQLLLQVGDGEAAKETDAADSPLSPGEQLNQFQTLVQERLAAAGIITSIRFEITSEAHGQLQITGDHPKRAEIERALLNDPDIARAFHQLAAAHHRDQTAEQHEQFAQQYLADGTNLFAPTQATTARFAVLINGDEAEFAIR